MARKKHYQDLWVYMNGILVGKLKQEVSSQLIFTYDQDWLNSEKARPISLSMPLTEIPYKGYIVNCYFNNLLPDSDIIRERIQTRFKTASTQCFDLLSFIGRDCIGALQLLTEPISSTIKKIEGNLIDNKSIAKLLKHYQIAPLGMDRQFDFRISVAGAQEKTALLWYQNQWLLPKATTPTSHIIKLPIGRIEHAGIDLSDSVENEWLCLQILSAFNLPVNSAKIMHFDEIKTLVVERFDRRWSDDKQWLIRLPQEDLCQALGVPPGLKYESDGGPGIQDIMRILQGSQDPHRDRKKFMKSVFLFWVLGAIDGHAKNFSLFIENLGHYRLTPVYDVISAYPLAAKQQVSWKSLKMAMSLRGQRPYYRWDKIQIRHWLAMAEKCQFPANLMQDMINEVCDLMENVITQVQQALPPNFPSNISDPIFNGMRQMKKRCTILE